MFNRSNHIRTEQEIIAENHKLWRVILVAFSIAILSLMVFLVGMHSFFTPAFAAMCVLVSVYFVVLTAASIRIDMNRWVDDYRVFELQRSIGDSDLMQHALRKILDVRPVLTTSEYTDLCSASKRHRESINMNLWRSALKKHVFK